MIVVAEWIFSDQTKILKKLGILYREFAGIFHRGEIEIFFDKLWQVFIHEKIEEINYNLNLKLPHSSLLWITLEIVRQWGQQQKLSVTETRKRLKGLRRCLGKLIEVEVLNVYCLISYLFPYMYVAELKAAGNPQSMTIITGKRLRLGERIPIGLFKLTPLAKELHTMEWRTKMLGRLGDLSQWKTAEPVTGLFVDARTRKKLWKLIFRDNKDLVIPISISRLSETAEISDIKKLLRDHPHLKSDSLFNFFKGFLDENKVLEIAVNAAEAEEIKKLKLDYNIHDKVL